MGVDLRHVRKPAHLCRWSGSGPGGVQPTSNPCSSAKTLPPTLIVQEGEQAQVETGQSVITGVDATETANGSTQFQNTRENAGLT